MNNNPEQETVYRYFTLGTRGTITLVRDTVHTKSRTKNGWWEQTVPLEALNPYYGTLKAMPPVALMILTLVSFFIGIGLIITITGTSFYPEKVVGIVLMLGGLTIGACLYPYRKCEWIIFQSTLSNGSIYYTRQGPDEQKCDEFTQLLVERIQASSEAEKSNTTASVKS